MVIACATPLNSIGFRARRGSLQRGSSRFGPHRPHSLPITCLSGAHFPLIFCKSHLVENKRIFGFRAISGYHLPMDRIFLRAEF